MWPCIVTNFFVINPTRCTNFTILFWHEALHVSGSSAVRHQEFIHCTLSNGICHVCRQLSSRTRTEQHPGPAWKLSTNLYGIYNCWMYSEKTPDDGRTNCPKHVEFHDKIKLVKLVHLVGFVIKKSGDEIFQKNSQVHSYWPQKECRNFGTAESRTSWQETKKIQIKFATTCNRNGQQQDGKRNAEL